MAEKREHIEAPSKTGGDGLPGRLSLLRQKLSQKAKQEPQFVFYALYDQTYGRDVPAAAWSRARASKGAPGVDGVRIEQIAASDASVREFLDAIQESLQKQAHQPEAVRRICIRNWQPCNCLRMPAAKRFQKSRMPGNPLARFDEGRVGQAWGVALSPALLAG